MSANVGSDTIVTNGLVLYLDAANYKSYTSGSTTWRDLTINGNNGTLINGPAFNSGNAGSIVFDGVDDYVLLPNIGVTNLAAFSVAFWAKTDTGIINPTLYSEGTPSSWPSNLFIIYFGDIGSSAPIAGTIRVYFANSSRLTGTIDVRNAGWKYVTYIQTNTSSRKIYLNTALESSNTDTITNTATHASIGAASNNGNYVQFFKGNLAALTTYNRALTESEMLQNYNATKGRFGL